jgi:hypothetical protein
MSGLVRRGRCAEYEDRNDAGAGLGGAGLDGRPKARWVRTVSPARDTATFTASSRPLSSPGAVNVTT